MAYKRLTYILLEFHKIVGISFFYQTSHFLTGFIGEPSGHWKSLANSLRLLIGPMTRNRLGGCGSITICLTNDSAMHKWSFETFFFILKSSQTKVTQSKNGAPVLSGRYPEHLWWCIIQTGQCWFGTIFLFPFAIRHVCFFDATIIGNVLALRDYAIQLFDEEIIITNDNPCVLFQIYVPLNQCMVPYSCHIVRWYILLVS